MKKLFQNLGSGETTIEELPSPVPGEGELLIASSLSLISAGTERMLVDFGKASLLEKAKQQPERVKDVLDKARTDGLISTYKAVKNKLDQPIPLGYSNVGVVASAGKNTKGLKPGDRVVSNGSHAELVKVPINLCAKIPAEVTDETASFTVVASIGLQGIRLIRPTLGECVTVFGVGLIGLLTVQLLRAQGCRVLAIDFDQSKLKLAEEFGAEIHNLNSGNPVDRGIDFSNGRGVDAVLITASTKSSDPVTHAAQMSRKRGRIVLIGVIGLSLNRADFYEKELSFQVSCSYGPGRYDKDYEDKGQDYPIAYVRWTEQRNFEAVLELMRSGKLRTDSLISHSFLFEDAGDAYKTLSEEAAVLGILLKYESTIESRLVDSIAVKDREASNLGDVNVALVGAGNYASAVLIPALKKTVATAHTIVSSSGSGTITKENAKGFLNLTNNIESVLKDESVNALVISTRHNTHGSLVSLALDAGKNVFVEKPLCLTMEELTSIEAAYQRSDAILMVGFNRRFSPLVQKIAELLASSLAPKSFVMTVNAGAIPADHWTQDSSIGGGRILGEACHFVDLLRFLARSPIEGSTSVSMQSEYQDTQSISLKFANGSIGTIHYFANGNKSFPKERLEIFSEGRILQLDNFKKLKAYGWPGFKSMTLSRQNKGQDACLNAFVESIVTSSSAPIPFSEIVEVSKVCIELSHK